MQTRIEKLKEHLALRKAKRDLLKEQSQRLQKNLEELAESSQDHADALPLVLQVGKMYREAALSKVETLVTQALQAVFEKPYEFRLLAVEKRGQVELTPRVFDGELELDPVASMGGGVVDVISIALRVVLWTMSANRTDPVLVLDEPARLVNSDSSVANLSVFLQKLSSSLEVQFLVVTNRPGLAQAADRRFTVVKEGGVANVVRDT